jgi:hypothetical protein
LLIVDERDSVLNRVDVKEEAYGKKAVDAEELKKREEEAGKVLSKTANGLIHMVETMQGKRVLRTFNANDIFYGAEGAIAIGLRPMGGKEYESEEYGKRVGVAETPAEGELCRWMAPELLSGEVKEATEETLSYALGMILYKMLTYRVPFQELSALDARKRIVENKRPSLDPLRDSVFAKLLEACWSKDRTKRPALVQLRREFLVALPENGKNATKSETIDIETLTSLIGNAEEDGEGQPPE